ncbi:MAG TPA: hypothetical protein PKI20_02445 [Verrucomicrobiota bacterium]|nr:hypothetical protein [Verrucomicrobiota bacterium]HQL76666.1 hypothetical protein [Verrucomicrobiota bacterium]
MTDNAYQPTKILAALEVLLAQLEATLAPYLNEADGRADRLNIQIDGYKEKAARLRSVLSKHQAAERRKRELDKQNRQLTKRH